MCVPPTSSSWILSLTSSRILRTRIIFESKSGGFWNLSSFNLTSSNCFCGIEWHALLLLIIIIVVIIIIIIIIIIVVVIIVAIIIVVIIIN